jgi:hypothetical protein
LAIPADLQPINWDRFAERHGVIKAHQVDAADSASIHAIGHEKKGLAADIDQFADD